ncbi:sensor histidine kinase [Paenibacillus eucommiae]|uniref:histidine kinase n=1 Tax=Paenibacillus eucommiae TaxID=1355755 RepID=A0ABS4IN78_9BACL|nr:sensor histidine kinase [Paenibacillus eucommiae]MBP1989018.1 signal transduction histidine kinase [Paenibacillus eucommiae]
MRLFWKEHIPLLLFYSLQMALVPLLYWLSGEGRPFHIVLYGVILSSVVLAIYLGYRYFNYRALYQRLDEPRAEIDELLQSIGEAPLAEAVGELLRNYDRHYQEKLHHHMSRTEQHIVFINRWVHQMKTPISVIQLMLQELEDQAADSIQEELDRLRKGLEMVIYTARLDRFEQDFTVEPTPLRHAVNQVVAANRKLFIRKGISPDLQVNESLSVYTDPKWLRFMLDQIVINALNYSTGEGKTIRISAYTLGQKTILEIRDQGIGIVKEDLNRVFNPYYTGDRGRQYHESTGMGLYLVKEICTRLDHEVSLQSEPGEGTIVKFIFQQNS